MAISGTIEVTSAGTRVQPAYKGNFTTAVLSAGSDNTAAVYLGGGDDSPTAGSRLVRGGSIQLHLADPISNSQFWADAANNNDQVDFIGSL